MDAGGNPATIKPYVPTGTRAAQGVNLLYPVFVDDLARRVLHQSPPTESSTYPCCWNTALSVNNSRPRYASEFSIRPVRGRPFRTSRGIVGSLGAGICTTISVSSLGRVTALAWGLRSAYFWFV